MLSASGLEVNEAALTGESLPVPKGPEEFTDIGRIVLEGSDVVVGHGRAVVIAVGRHTRLGATAAALNGGIQRDKGLGDPDRTPHGRSNMCNNGISTRLSHGLGFLRFGHINDRKQVHFAGQGHHFELFLHAHSGFLEHLPELTIHNAMGWKVVHAAEPHRFDLQKPMPHPAARVGSVHAANHRHFLYNRQHLVFADVHGDLVRVAVSHQPAGRAVAGPSGSQMNLS